MQEIWFHKFNSSIEICKAYLGAFRGIAMVSGSSSLWSPDSIAAALISASSVYSTACGRKANLSLEIGDDIPGYSNNFVLAVMLPLLENAIEASPNNSPISVAYDNTDGVARISITNHADPLPSTEILKSGYTTKPGHDGLGLTIVQDLLSTVRGARLDLKVSEVLKTVTFTIVLPAGAS